MKKIAFISLMRAASWGGSEELWSQAAMRLAGKGFIVGANIKKWSEEHPRIKQLEVSGCTIERRKYKRNVFQEVVQRIYKNEIFYNWLDKFSPDIAVISIGTSLHGAGWMRACSMRGIPFVVIAHCATENAWPSDERIVKQSLAYSAARKCFFVSHNNKDLTELQIGLRFKNAIVVRNPYMVSYDVNLPWPPTDRVKIACVGRFELNAKGQDILFKVLSLEKWRKRPVTLTFFGKGPNESSLLRLCRTLGSDSVQCGGFVDNVESIWRTHHVLALPSRYEGIPLTLVEAMMCARVCVVADTGGSAELIKDNINGFVAAAPTLRLFDEALERAWQRRESWKHIGQTAARDIREIIPRDPVGEFIKELEAVV